MDQIPINHQLDPSKMLFCHLIVICKALSISNAGPFSIQDIVFSQTDNSDSAKISVTLQNNEDIKDTGMSLSLTFVNVNSETFTGPINFEQKTKLRFESTFDVGSFPSNLEFNTIWDLESGLAKHNSYDADVQITSTKQLVITSDRRKPYVSNPVALSFNTDGEGTKVTFSLTVKNLASAPTKISVQIKDLQTGGDDLTCDFTEPSSSNADPPKFIYESLIGLYDPTATEASFRNYSSYKFGTCSFKLEDEPITPVGIDINCQTFMTPRTPNIGIVTNKTTPTFITDSPQLSLRIESDSFNTQHEYDVKIQWKDKDTHTFTIPNATDSMKYLTIVGEFNTKFQYDKMHTIVSIQDTTTKHYLQVSPEIKDFFIARPQLGITYTNITVADFRETPEATDDDPDPQSYAITKALLRAVWYNPSNVNRPSPRDVPYYIYDKSNYFLSPETLNDDTISKNPDRAPIGTGSMSWLNTQISMNITVDGAKIDYEKEYVVEVPVLIHPLLDDHNYLSIKIPPKNRILKASLTVDKRSLERVSVVVYGVMNESRQYVNTTWTDTVDSTVFHRVLSLGYDPVENLQKASGEFDLAETPGAHFAKNREYNLTAARFVNSLSLESQTVNTNEISSVLLPRAMTPQNSRHFKSPIETIPLPLHPPTIERPLQPQLNAESDEIDVQYVRTSSFRLNVSDAPHLRVVECTFPEKEREKGMKKGQVHYKVIGHRMLRSGLINIFRAYDSNNPTKGVDAYVSEWKTNEDATEITFTCEWENCNTTARLMYELIMMDENGDDQLASVVFLADGVGLGVARAFLKLVLLFFVFFV
ncbi:hypothetical protein BLNAU_4510 [Blattamonas nauphoetae]|uniref:Uncharacterized protein n=1 Tax=Blattamonas nauphoetae TaxID=2049346 RepID=A0ABQ9YA23_9EUKA|nr:hypothetical protein BLNAU_4510 [Blattamonas nauphoetae]